MSDEVDRSEHFHSRSSLLAPTMKSLYGPPNVR